MILLESITVSSGDLWLDRKRFRDLIAAAGYDEAEINSMLDWLETQWFPARQADWGDDTTATDGLGRGIRLLGDDEREFLTPPAFGYLLDLLQGGQISRQQMEMLIHYASLVSVAPLEQPEIDELLDQVLLAPPSGAPLSYPTDGLRNLH
jgi:uncharacterized protein Smg (DUF494 family)